MKAVEQASALRDLSAVMPGLTSLQELADDPEPAIRAAATGAST